MNLCHYVVKEKIMLSSEFIVIMCSKMFVSVHVGRNVNWAKEMVRETHTHKPKHNI